MKKVTLSGLALLVFLGAPLAAQDTRFGLTLNLGVPTGAFAGTDYPADAYVASPTHETYNAGLGATFTMSFPVDKATAFRLSLGGQSFTGRATAPGYESLNLQHQMFSLGGEAQFFPGEGSAYRQSGTYFLVGASVDFERFDASYWDPNYYPTDTLNKTRMGGIVGIGHTFRRGVGLRYLVEGAYHKTLTQHDTAAGDPPASDFFRFSFGIIL